MLATNSEWLSLYKTVDYCPSHLLALLSLLLKPILQYQLGTPKGHITKVSCQLKRLWRPKVLCLNFTPIRSSILLFSNLNSKLLG